MELKGLYPFVLIMIFVGLLLGVGLLIFDNFGRVVRDPAVATNELFNASNGAYVDLTQSTITGSSAVFINATDGASISSSYFKFDSDLLYNADKVKLTTSGQAAGLNFTNVNVTYTYGASTTTTTTMTSVGSAIAAIGSTWMSLIVTVAVLAIILTLVIRSFANKR